jgi:gamma-glutamyl hercynylcysteine S-oxide synthase
MNRVRNLLAVGLRDGRWLAGIVAAVVFVCGALWGQAWLLGLGAVLLCFVLRRLGTPGHGERSRERRRRRNRAEAEASAESHEKTEGEAPRPRQSRTSRFLENPTSYGTPASTNAFVDELLANGRYALLLRPETKQHLTQAQLMQAIRQLDEAMALVPAGRVLLGQLAEQAHSVGSTGDVDAKLAARNLVHVEAGYLDRFCVTNEQFQQFVDAGGYEQLEFWHEAALPALLDFVDQTGNPGPRFWSDGEFPSGEGRLPVVGVSWFEAWAYAHWVGKQLPTDAQWTKAGAWPVESAPGRIAQRRYPWGESFDVRRAHLFGSGTRGPVPVDEFPGGVSVGGIHQLIGNVWEWTSTPLVELGDPSLYVSESVMSIRGGAFDTYFENHASCHYQSGDHALVRKQNIGFRLALPMRDLEAHEAPAAESPATEVDVKEYEAELVGST